MEPKLKVGDTFTVTPKMKSIDCDEFKVGIAQTIQEVDQDRGFYTNQHSCVMRIEDIDKCLSTLKSRPGEWETHFVRSDGIKITKDAIELDGKTFTPQELKAHFTKCRMALTKHKELQ